MSKLTLTWLFILSLGVALGMLLFNDNAFNVCFSPEVSLYDFNIPYLAPVISCSVVIFLICFLIMFLGPLAITGSIYVIYVLMFNRKMAFARTITWISWLIFCYYVLFELHFIPSV